MARKKKNKKKKFPLAIRQVDSKNEKRLGVPFDTMTDNAIAIHFLRSRSFMRAFMRDTQKDYERCLNMVWETLNNERKDFAQFVRVCHKAFKNTGEDRRGFFRQIVYYIQDESRLLYQNKMEEQLSEQYPSPKEWFLPKIYFFLNPHNYLYDFSIDFFLNNYGEALLREKYKLNRPNYFKMLNSLQESGIRPESL